ncbi:4-hydroxy-tetrahydrodipicolinate synthase [uncultured Abyssibacter sp.]|uniref:4-hydroxy-tetrahydrodipicolinate synthase n=1 Tax=uncultured Abyssibacter sp. TaxID=2320202 RepID=UPI0032B0F965
MFEGSNVALVTPMDADGAVDYSALDALVDWHIEAGTQGLVAVGTTGESATLTVDEHVAVIRRVIEVTAGRVPVIAGTGANSTAEAIALTQEAEAAGADGALVVTPYYNKPPQEGLYRHYIAIAEASTIPIILYNVPGRTGCDLAPATVERLAAHPRIVALKEAVGDPQRVAELRQRLSTPFVLLSGDDGTSADAMLAGFDGVISVTANVVPQLMRRLCDAARSGDESATRAADAPMTGLHQALFLDPNPIPVKWALHLMKRIGPGIRLPLVPMQAQFETPLKTALADAGVPLEN